MLRLCLGVLLCLPALLQAAISIRVNASKSLATAGAEVAAAKDNQVHQIILEQFSQLGTFTIPSGNTSLSDTIVFTVDENVAQGIQLNEQPFLNIQGFPKPVVLKGLNFELTSNKASLSTNMADANHSLILRDCNFYGTDLSQGNFLNWKGRTGSKIQFERSFFAIRSNLDTTVGGLTRMNLSADTVLFSNCSFHFMGRADIMANFHFEMRQSTINRLVFNLSGERGVTARVYKNLFAFTNPTNVISTSAIRYALYHNGSYERFSGLETNYRYTAWTGVVVPPATPDLYVDNSTAIPSLPGKLPTELWNWYADIGSDSVGIGHGSDKGGRYNVFPGANQVGLRYQGDSVSLSFRTSLFPRTLAVSLGLEIPRDSLFDLRYVWPNRQAVGFGNFQIDSMTVVGGTARHGSPILLTQNNPNGSFLVQSPYGSRASLRVFKNEDLRARFFIPAYKAVLPRGLLVKASYVSPDSLIFNRVDSAGYPTYSDNAPPDSLRELLPATRYLGVSMEHTATALFSDSLRFGSRRTHQVALLPDSMAWLRIAGNVSTLHKNRRAPDGMNWVTAPAGETTRLVLVEHLSVPRATQTLVRPAYSIYTNSRLGFQLLHDTVPVPSPGLFDKTSTAVALRMIGRGLQDSVVIEFTPQGSYTAQWTVNGVTDTLRSVFNPQSGKVRVLLGSMDTVGTLFLGRRLNVRANTVFNGQVSGLQVNGFLSPSAGMLSASSMGEQDLVSDEILLNHRFIKGWFITADQVSASGFSVTDNLGTIVDAGAIRAYTRFSSTAPWTLASLTLPVAPVGAATVSGLSLSTGRMELIFLETLANLSTVPAVAVQDAGAENNTLRFTQRYDAALANATHFEIEVRSIGVDGTALVNTSSRAPIESTVELTLANNRIANYRIKVFAGDRLLANGMVDTLPGAFNLSQITKLDALAGMQWHLIAVPHGVTGFADTVWMKRHGSQTRYRDSVEVRTVKAGTFSREPLVSSRKPGDGLLIIATDSLKLTWKASQVPPLSKLKVDGPEGGGWKLISHPFIFPMRTDSVLSTHANASPAVTLSAFFELRRVGNQLSWNPVTTLAAHKGYAYRFLAGESLTFDPFKAKAALPKAGLTQAGSNQPTYPSFEWKEAHSKQTLWVMPGGSQQKEWPYLPLPGQAADLRLGGGQGYLRKAIQAGGGMQQLPLRVLSQAPGKATWNWENAGSGMQAVLVDSALGQFYHSGDTVLLTGARQSLTLAIGSREEIESLQAGWKDRNPGALHFRASGLVQGRQSMDLAFDWPAQMLQNGGTISITVTDSRGRVHHSEKLRPSRVGTQSHAWPKPQMPGHYVIQISVHSESFATTWQQKCMVLP